MNSTDRIQRNQWAGSEEHAKGKNEKVKEPNLSGAVQHSTVSATEEEMRKRRERLKAWQEAKQKKAEDDSQHLSISSEKPPSEKIIGNVSSAAPSVSIGQSNFNRSNEQPTNQPAKKKSRWSDENTEEVSVSNEYISPTSNVMPTLHHHKTTTRWDESDGIDRPSMPLTANGAVLNSQNKTNIVKSNSVEINDEEDPLDAFMTSLYDSGEVAGQHELKNSSLATSFHKAPVLNSSSGMSAHSSSLQSKNTVKVSDAQMDEEEDNIEDALDLHGSHVSNSVHHNSNHVITLEEIMKNLNQEQQQSRRGWESDAVDSGVNSPEHSSRKIVISTGESETEREAREVREHKEFVDAIRKAREEEGKALQRLQKLEEEQEQNLLKRNRDGKSKGEELGRVFVEDDDIDLLDEFEDQQKRRSALELLEEAKKGKVLRPIDHSKIQYLSFRKNLYVVPRPLAKLSSEELATRREDLHIKVHGNGCPPPVETWEQCGLSDRILDCIYKNNLTEPFAIQKQAIPAIMCGRDVIGVAKTGSGKTLAFLLPMFRHILDQPPLQDGDGPIGLIMAPARELAFQIFNQAKKFCRSLGLRAACIYGGAGVAEQIADLKRGSEIVVCTPGRMIDILCMQAGKLISLKRVTMIVMDEADRMFDMGFEPQIKMILQNVRPDKQTVLFSATFPKVIEKLAKSILRLPLEIIVGERSTVNKDITQFIEVHEEDDKFLRLLQLLGIYYEKGSILIFVDKQEKCDQLFQELLRLGYPCLSLHGGKDQVDRDHTLHEFKSGIKTVMIATSVAGRGLDVPEIVCVVNYHCPNHLEDYVHRVGRTGRAGRKGVAYTFLSPSKEEQFAPIMVKALMKANNNNKEEVPAELWNLAEGFKQKVARGEAQWSSSGFVGKGFTFDSNELNEAQRAELLQKKQYALEQGITVGKEDEVDADAEMDMYMDDLVESGLGGEYLPVSTTHAGLTGQLSTSQKGSENGGPASVDAQAALAKARIIAQQLLLSKGTSSDAGAIGATAAVGNHFSDELEINDYPIQARRKVTNKNALDEITERTGAAIISRGSFVPAGKKPEVGEKKLFLLIEGRSELSVRQAKLEIQRALEEETIKIASSTTSSGGGRYSVV